MVGGGITLEQFSTRVLLVDNVREGDGLEAAVADLDRNGCRVERAGGLSRALERLSLGGVDVVLLDLDLPDSRGLGTLERARGCAPDVTWMPSER